MRSEYALARKLQERGHAKIAARIYEDVLNHIPVADAHWRSATYYRRGECFWGLGRAGEAYLSFQSAVEADSSNLAARLRLGTILLAGGAPDRAGEQATAVLRGSYGNTEALALLGAASSEAGQDFLAEAAFRQVLEREPGRVSVALALAEILNRRDATGEARDVLRKAAENSEAAVPWMALGRLEEQDGNAFAAEQAYRQAVTREDTPDVNLRLAQFLQRSAQVEEAKKILERVDHMRPLHPTALPDFKLLAEQAPGALEQYVNAMRSGALHTRHNKPASEVAEKRAALAARIIEADLQTAQSHPKPQKAISVARLHMVQYGNDLDAATRAMLQAEVELVSGDLASAQQHAASAVELAPKSAASRYVLGLVKQRGGEWVLARNAWLDALEQDEDFIPARLALARESLHQGDAGGAEQYILPVIREEPANLRALCLYARALLAQGRFPAARTIANRAVAVNKTAPEPRIILGEIALQQKDYAGSLLQFERALIQDPQSVDALDGLVRVYRRGEITRPMLRNLEKQAQSAPQSATLMELAGRLYEDHGWSAGAERCFRRALDMDPLRSTAAAALVRLLAARGETHTAIELAGKVGGYTTALVSGFTAQKRNDPTAAIAYYEAALREGEQSGVAANNLAWLYAQQNTNLDRALVLALRARKAAPSDPAVLDTVGFVHLRRREYSQAIDVLKGAASLAYSRRYSSQPELGAEISRHLSEAYLRAGLPVEVRSATGPKP